MIIDLCILNKVWLMFYTLNNIIEIGGFFFISVLFLDQSGVQERHISKHKILFYFNVLCP